MNRPVGRVILRNTAWNYAATFFSLGLGLILVPFLVRHLGNTQYGLWVLVGGISGYAALLDLGFAASLVKWVAEYRARDALEEMNDFLSTMLGVYSVIGLVTAALTVTLGLLFDRIFSVPPEEVWTARLVVFVVGGGLAVSFPINIFGGVIAAYQRYDISNALTITNLVLGVGLIVLFVSSGYGVLAVAVVQLVVMLATHAIRIYAVRRIVPSFSIGFRRFRRQGLWTVGTYSVFVCIQNLAERLVFKTDEIVIGLFLPLSAITPYSIGLKLNNAVRTLSQQLVQTLFPIAAHLHADRDTVRLRRLAIDGTRLTLALGLPPTLSIVLLARPIVAAWVGPGYEEAATVMTLLAFGTIASIVQWVPVTIVEAMGRVKSFATTAVLEALANLILSIVFVRRFGIAGVALGTAIPAIISNVLVQTPFACRALGIPFKEFVRLALGPPVLAAVPVFIGLYLTASYAAPTGLGVLIGFLALSTGLYWTVFALCCLPRAEAKGYAMAVGQLLGWR